VDDFRPRRPASNGVERPFEVLASGDACHGAETLTADVCHPASSACDPAPAAPRRATAPLDAEEGTAARLHRLLTNLGDATVPRRNGELVFDEPWQGRVFGMAVALSEQGLLPWEEFRQALIAQIAAAEARGGEFRYYHAWLAAFEQVLAARGAVRPEELEETTFQFEFGERDAVRVLTS
jgi:nitrile hydratase accessory protein